MQHEKYHPRGSGVGANGLREQLDREKINLLPVAHLLPCDARKQ